MVKRVKYWLYKLFGGELSYEDWYLVNYTDLSFTVERDVSNIIKELNG